MAKSTSNTGGTEPDHRDPKQVEKDMNDDAVTGGGSGRHNVPKDGKKS